MDELAPIQCVKHGKYRLTFRDGKIEERWIPKGKAYLMLNNLRHYHLVKMEFVDKPKKKG